MPALPITTCSGRWRLHLYPTEFTTVVSLTMPFGLLVIKNYMDDIPNDIVEASVIDGCSHLTIYWRIVLPFLLPLVALRKNDLLPVTKLPTFFLANLREIIMCFLPVS